MPYDPNLTPQAPLPISMLPDAAALTDDDLLLVTQPNNAQGKSRRVKIEKLAVAILRRAISLPSVSSWVNSQIIVLPNNSTDPICSVGTGLQSTHNESLYDAIMRQALPELDRRYDTPSSYGDLIAATENGSTFSIGQQSSSNPGSFELLTGRSLSQTPTKTIQVPPGWIIDVGFSTNITKSGSGTIAQPWIVSLSTGTPGDVVGEYQTKAEIYFNATNLQQYGRLVWKNTGSSAANAIITIDQLSDIASGTSFSVSGNVAYIVQPSRVKM